MSDAEKKRRQLYKENRSKWILIQVLVLSVLIVALLVSTFTFVRLDKTYYVEYTERTAVDYKAQYIPNDEYGEWIGEGQSYISALTKNLQIDFDYSLHMDTANVDYDYAYRIDATMQIYDKANGLPIYQPVDEIVANTLGEQSSASDLSIEKTVTVDFAAYNEKAKEFIRKYQLRDVTATLIVGMHIDVIGSSDAFDEHASNGHDIQVTVPLTATTFRITTNESASADAQSVLAYKTDNGRDVFRILSIVFASALAAALAFFLFFVYFTRNEDITYTIRVKRLVSAYESFIQRITTPFCTNGYQCVRVDSFKGMLEIRDTIQAPILMNENEDKTCTTFVIPTDTKLLYVFDVKVDNYDDIYGAPTEPTVAEAMNALLDVCEPVTEPIVETVTEPVETVTETVAEPIVETVIEPAETVAEPIADTVPPFVLMADGEGSEGCRILNGEIVHIRYRTSFTSRLIQAKEELQLLYSALKNELLSYVGVKAKTSAAFESFGKGRIACAKVNIKGAAVQLYLALDPAEYDLEKYFLTFVGDKPKLDKVPLMLKVKGQKTLRFAQKLIADVMEKAGIERGETQNVDYRMPYEDTETLVDRGLVKVIYPDGIKIDETTEIRKLDVGEHLKTVKSEQDAPEEMTPVAEDIAVTPAESTLSRVEILFDDQADKAQLAEAIRVALTDPDFSDEELSSFTEEAPYKGEDGVGVVSVAWPEGKGSRTVHHYDPSGEALERGDIVLVPDESDAIRRATVTQGNHLADPNSIRHPLKRILGVIRKRLERMIIGRSGK